MTSPAPNAKLQVREELQRRILSGEIRPGERLAQQQLARQLGVGQGTVRESLIDLEWLGLVESVDRLGAFVANLDTARLREAYHVRAALEGLAARLACESASPGDVAILRSLAGRIWQLSTHGQHEEAGHVDRTFHMHIMKLTRNSILPRLADTYRVLGMAMPDSRDPDQVRREHLSIIEAISNRSPDEAEQCGRRHVEEVMRMMARQVGEMGFAPATILDTQKQLSEVQRPRIGSSSDLDRKLA